MGFSPTSRKQPVLGLQKEAKIKSQRGKGMLISIFRSQIVQLQLFPAGKEATASMAGDGGAENRRQKGRVLTVHMQREWTHLPGRSLVTHSVFA